MSTKSTKSSQKSKFIEAARTLGCDESPEAFASKLKAISGVKPMTNDSIKKKAAPVKKRPVKK